MYLTIVPMEFQVKTSVLHRGKNIHTSPATARFVSFAKQSNKMAVGVLDLNRDKIKIAQTAGLVYGS